MELSLQNWYLFPISTLIATTAMASGIGGAIFFSPLFMIVLKLEPSVAIGTALTTELFGFSSGVYAYWRRRLIDFRWGRVILSFSIPAAFVGSLLADDVPGDLLRMVFSLGIIFIGTQLYVAYSKERRERNSRGRGEPPEERHEDSITDWQGTVHRYTICDRGLGKAYAVVGGTLLGMISVGLAELQEYHMIARCRIPPPVAVATSIFVVVVSVLVASSGHFYNFATSSDPDLLESVANVVVFTVPGVIIGGQIGPYIQSHVNPHAMKLALAVLFVAVGVFLAVGML